MVRLSRCSRMLISNCLNIARRYYSTWRENGLIEPVLLTKGVRGLCLAKERYAAHIGVPTSQIFHNVFQLRSFKFGDFKKTLHFPADLEVYEHHNQCVVLLSTAYVHQKTKQVKFIHTTGTTIGQNTILSCAHGVAQYLSEDLTPLNNQELDFMSYTKMYDTELRLNLFSGVLGNLSVESIDHANDIAILKSKIKFKSFMNVMTSFDDKSINDINSMHYIGYIHRNTPVGVQDYLGKFFYPKKRVFLFSRFGETSHLENLAVGELA
ncbi:unnamed protein product [Didymodactylos carnosus]|uniref:Uncharacterized protein n=1 Tax=Didymodactylos carnosus TaxID=1234261 RepID=A0A815X9R1_9BILA|nr:unnamed protein product [Didymodactylos carnosus]CAF4415935.1 unnamed protein product [Didymodactylos carnosus]